MKVYFQNFGFSPYKQKIKKIFVQALTEISSPITSVSVNIKLVSKQEIQALNNEHRNIDKVTDVLSFPNIDFQKGKGITLTNFCAEINPDDNTIFLGDIAICMQQARAQAKEYRHSVRREVCFLALHGFLHLLGFDHIEKQDEQEMQNLAKRVLQKEKVRRNV